MPYRISVVIEKDPHGYYAFSPQIEGCQTQGTSLDEVMERMKETIGLYLEPYGSDVGIRQSL